MKMLMKTIVHMPGFEKPALALLGEDGLADLIGHLAQHELEGPMIPGTGGFRKIRWARKNEGKRGGFRVIYFVAPAAIYPTLIYGKNTIENLSQAQKNQLREVAKTFL
jgi:hypothetical protein